MEFKKTTQTAFCLSEKKWINIRGFSLVELMVVVAIIGILATLVVPAYTKISYKVRQSEAKMNLSGLYTSEKAFYSEYGKYHISFSAVGFSPEGSLRYNIGFSASQLAPTVFASAADGYNTPLSPAELGYTSTTQYCEVPSTAAPGAPGNSCKILLGADGQLPPSLGVGFTTLDSDFMAGALITAPANFAMNELLPGSESLEHASFLAPLSPVASLLALLSTRAYAIKVGPITTTITTWKVDSWAMNSTKSIVNQVCTVTETISSSLPCSTIGGPIVNAGTLSCQ